MLRFLEGSRKQRDQLYLAFRTARAVFLQGLMDLRSPLLLLMVDEESYNWISSRGVDDNMKRIHRITLRVEH
ncbi:Pentatricopeptide repeat superfamily protein [Prunus dulcis]|uniref:Pentatricopeptide repeat superfamily protein n=1 Tax=Prunus dulcis TaxID=3755 RepID=A0A4Y1RN10_PRUDU|nr:Pentatricopeptide repeat superfamily protein [Prunus dulcis]